jgi:hypothetical protein
MPNAFESPPPCGEHVLTPPMAEPTNKLPFWIHQVVEYAIGALIAYQAIHSPSPVVPLLAGLAVVVLAATADGPVACFHVVPRPVHRILDIIVAFGLLVVALFFGSEVGGAGQFMLVLGALGLGVLTLRSDYRPKISRRQRAAAAPPDSGSTRAEDIGRHAGRLVGRGMEEYRKRRSGPKTG